jgi:hypothetical protein
MAAHLWEKKLAGPHRLKPEKTSMAPVTPGTTATNGSTPVAEMSFPRFGGWKQYPGLGGAAFLNSGGLDYVLMLFNSNSMSACRDSSGIRPDASIIACERNDHT